MIQINWHHTGFPGAVIQIGLLDQAIGEARTFALFTSEPLPEGQQLPAVEFLNQSQSFSSTSFSVQDALGVGGGTLLIASNPTYTFGESTSQNCTAGATEVQTCGNDGTQTRVCQSDGIWGLWGTCNGATGP